MARVRIIVTTTALAAALIGLAPTASADNVVFIGGTGTGIIPQGKPRGLIDPFVPNVDNITSPVYDGSPIANPQNGVPIIAPIVAAQPGPTVVIGASKGAQVARGIEAVDTRTDTQYVYIGDPDGPNGISRRSGLSPKPRPATHNVRIVNAEYDGVGDMPDRFNPLATVNALAGWAFIHTQYGNGTDADPLTHLGNGRNTVVRNPNGTTTTHTLIPTKHLPLLKPLRDTELTLTHQARRTDALEAAIRPVIDAGYSRNDKPKQTSVKPKTVAPSKKQVPDHAAANSEAGTE